jgi:tRNA (guanine-N7-)-methyltransferase
VPHLKVKPFPLNKIEKSSKRLRLFNAMDGHKGSVVLYENGEDVKFLDIVEKESEYLVKPNAITRGADAHKLKKILEEFAQICELEVIHSNTQLNANKPKLASEYLKSIEDFYDFKTDFEKVKVEVGFGSARHLLYRASQEPDTLFIGIEIHTPSINQLLKQIALQEIKNILVLNYDARLLLEMLPSNSLETIYVHFPVPWDKKPHRRVISPAFVSQALRALRKGGKLELRTDSDNYYSYALEVFSALPKAEFSVLKNSDIEIISKYEERWRRMEKDIYTLSLYSLEESKEEKIELNFDFDKISPEDIDVPKESIVKSDFFVHFGRRFKSDSGKGLVLECSFGSFTMPEKKIIVVNEESCYYLPSKPVKTKVNQKAHNLIKEVLNG